MDKDKYFKEGDVVILRQELQNRPVMMVDKIVRSMLKTGTTSLLGIRCFWFDKNGSINKNLYSSKDLRYATPDEIKKKNMGVFKVPSRIHELIGVSIPNGTIHHSDKFYYFKYMSEDVLKGKTYLDLVDLMCNELVKKRDFPDYDFIFDFSYPWREAKKPITFGRIVFTRQGDIDLTLSTNYTRDTTSFLWKTGADIVKFLIEKSMLYDVELSDYTGLVPTLSPIKRSV